MNINFVWYDKQKTINRICKDEKVGIFLASTCARYMDKFVPMDTGMLAQNYSITPFQITYTQPYAHRQYNGDHFNFQKDKHPNATAHWDRPTSQMHSADIAKEVTEFIRKL